MDRLLRGFGTGGLHVQGAPIGATEGAEVKLLRDLRAFRSILRDIIVRAQRKGKRTNEPVVGMKIGTRQLARRHDPPRL